ncbi:MAG TPA: flavodoxin family protein [Methanomassiliicoccales archaeon]
MKVLAINGSPRKNGNTAMLLEKALEGARAEGAETEIIHLYDLDFKGCISCFACKRIGGRSYGRCAVKDGLTSLLEKIPAVDAVIFGSPIYLGNVTGEMKSFLERLIFPYLVYDKERTMLFPKKRRNGWIYTMNIPESSLKDSGYEQLFLNTNRLMTWALGPSETLIVTDTYQFDDYSKYVNSMFDPELKAKRRKDVFPEDCAKAFQMGSRLAKGE